MDLFLVGFLRERFCRITFGKEPTIETPKGRTIKTNTLCMLYMWLMRALKCPWNRRPLRSDKYGGGCSSDCYCRHDLPGAACGATTTTTVGFKLNRIEPDGPVPPAPSLLYDQIPAHATRQQTHHTRKQGGGGSDARRCCWVHPKGLSLHEFHHARRWCLD